MPAWIIEASRSMTSYQRSAVARSASANAATKNSTPTNRRPARSAATSGPTGVRPAPVSRSMHESPKTATPAAVTAITERRPSAPLRWWHFTVREADVLCNSRSISERFRRTPCRDAVREARTEPTSRNVCRYFETSGFSRWTAIYGDGGVPPIWKVIRDGHDRAMDRVIDGFRTTAAGLRSTPAAAPGCSRCASPITATTVDGFDVSAPMVSFARYNTQDRGRGIPPRFFVGDIAALDAAPRILRSGLLPRRALPLPVRRVHRDADEARRSRRLQDYRFVRAGHAVEFVLDADRRRYFHQRESHDQPALDDLRSDRTSPLPRRPRR